ncbi:unnamed protein product [Thelazia callipaeda]|uniref:Uncharacterized protein n=1 Tax=Thelazia callipaeda TaxID=103827 RepID=A0A0N5D0Y0_THECL|nr:unnamed protein product [Thelazia callipaeda]
MTAILFRIFAIIQLVFALKDEFTELLFNHQQLCGNPFSDAQWIPVLDRCSIVCDDWNELCVEDDELQQKCNKLPPKCVNFIRRKSILRNERNLIAVC